MGQQVLPRPGVVRGATPDVVPNAWFDLNLMRWRGEQLQPIGGNVSLPSAVGTSPPRDVITWHDTLWRQWAVWGSSDKLYAYRFDLQTLYDITPAGVGPLDPPGASDGFGIGDYGMGLYGTPRADSPVYAVAPLLGDWWSLDLFGEDLLVVPTQDGRLFRWKPSTPTVAAVVVPGAPVQNKGVFVTDERHVVLIGAGGEPRRVQWCDQENPESWTATVSNLAGDKMLETEGRPLLGRRLTAGQNLILTDNDIHIMRYVGPPYAYGINKAGAGCGIASPRAWSQSGAELVWMGLSGFWRFEGALAPVPCDVQDWFYSLLNRIMVGRVFGMTNPAFREHWFFWPSEDSGECNRYIGLNYGGVRPWFIGRMSRTAGDITGSMVKPIAGGLDGKLYLHETGWTDDGASRAGQIFAETGDLRFGGGDRRFHVKQIEQDFTGPQQAIAFRFFLRERMKGHEQAKGPYPIIRDDGLVDCRFSTRGVRMRVEAVLDGPWALGRTELDVIAGGSR